MRASFSVLFALIMGFTILTVVAVTSFPTHPFIIVGIMAFTACLCVSAFRDLRDKPDFDPGFMTNMHSRYLILKDQLRDPLSVFRLSINFGCTVGLGAAFFAMFRGCSLETFLNVFFGTFLAGLIVATLVLGYLNRKPEPEQPA